MIRCLIAVATLAFASPLAAQAPPPPPPAASAETATIAAALIDMQAGRHDAAIARLDPLIAGYEKQNAGDPRMIFCAGSMTETIAYMTLGAAAKRDAVAIGPGWCEMVFVKGFVLADAKRFPEAQATIERAIAMRPSHAHYINELGYILQQQGQRQASYDAFARANDAVVFGEKDRERPEKSRAMRGMGFAKIELGQWDEAEALFRACLKLDPEDGRAKNELQYIADKRPKA